MPGLPGLDSNASVRRLFGIKRRGNRGRSGPYERTGPKRNESEGLGLLGDSALLWTSPEFSDSYHRLGEPCFVQQHGIDVRRVVTELQQVFEHQIAVGLFAG
jgi:hypothetical protein